MPGKIIDANRAAKIIPIKMFTDTTFTAKLTCTHSFSFYLRVHTAGDEAALLFLYTLHHVRGTGKLWKETRTLVTMLVVTS